MAFSMLATRKVASSAAARPQARSAGMRRPLVAVRATENEGRRGMDRAPADGGFWDEKRDVGETAKEVKDAASSRLNEAGQNIKENADSLGKSLGDLKGDVERNVDNVAQGVRDLPDAAKYQADKAGQELDRQQHADS